ncbi:tyrosine-protein phosphatase [Dietzia sp.]|uniref:tyrosine-protein phosphatase n=1 Tax=Dietzia sp. TaxID=1871616 RepID=UPI002FDB4522
MDSGDRDGFGGTGNSDEVGDLHVESMHNFRDVAGPGYMTPDGAMARGVLFRANVVAPSDADAEKLRALGLRRIVDLRRPEEVEKAPDHEVAGADYVHVDVLGTSDSAATVVGFDESATPADARRELRRLNRSFVVEPEFRARLRGAFEAIAESPGPVVFHCTVGKDRTGFTAAVLQLLAGMSHEDILADYLLTNERARDWAADLEAHFRERVPERADTLVELLQARPEYITDALDAIDAEYGSARAYLVDGLGMAPEAVDTLRARLVPGAG